MNVGGKLCECAIVAACVIAAVVLARYIRREQRRTVGCASCLKSLGYASGLYANDNDGEYPSDPGKLFPSYTTDGRIFRPHVGTAVVFTHADLPPGAKDASGVFGPEHTHYGFVSGLPSGADAAWVYMFCKTSHRGGKWNVLDVWGIVHAVSEEELEWLLETTLREARAAGHDAKVWGHGSEASGR